MEAAPADGERSHLPRLLCAWNKKDSACQAELPQRCLPGHSKPGHYHFCKSHVVDNVPKDEERAFFSSSCWQRQLGREQEGGTTCGLGEVRQESWEQVWGFSTFVGLRVVQSLPQGASVRDTPRCQDSALYRKWGVRQRAGLCSVTRVPFLAPEPSRKTLQLWDDRCRKHKLPTTLCCPAT
jgi:hypothetical protein